MAQPQFWGQFAAMDRKGKASGAGGAQSARTPRFLSMRYRQRHSIDDESLLSGASTSSEDGSAAGDAAPAGGAVMVSAGLSGVSGGAVCVAGGAGTAGNGGRIFSMVCHGLGVRSDHLPLWSEPVVWLCAAVRQFIICPYDTRFCPSSLDW